MVANKESCPMCCRNGGRVTCSKHRDPFKKNLGSKFQLQITELLLSIILKGVIVPMRKHKWLHSIEKKFLSNTKRKTEVC